MGPGDYSNIVIITHLEGSYKNINDVALSLHSSVHMVHIVIKSVHIQSVVGGCCSAVSIDVDDNVGPTRISLGRTGVICRSNESLYWAPEIVLCCCCCGNTTNGRNMEMPRLTVSGGFAD